MLINVMKNLGPGFFCSENTLQSRPIGWFCIMTTLAFNEFTAKTTGFNSLQLNCWKITQVIQKCQGSTSLTNIPNSHVALFSIIY